MFITILPLTFAVIAASVLLIRKYNERSWGKCVNKPCMSGKTVVITGANCGLGKATAEELAKLDARVILACRDLVKAEIAVEDIRRRTQNGELKVSLLDLASFESIQNFVNEFLETEKRLDVLINNAGVLGSSLLQTHEGFEPHFGINHLGHFLLTNLLLEKIKQSAPSRIVIVSSYLYKRGEINIDEVNSVVPPPNAYANSKLANILFCRELSKQLINNGVNVYAVRPGMVYTNLGRHAKGKWWKMVLFFPFALMIVRTAYQGCQTILYCAISKDLEKESGCFYHNCAKSELAEIGKDDVTAKMLWDFSKECIRKASDKVSL